jgi:hypothetical protein
MVDPSHSLRSGNGRADLAIHVLAPREPRPPLRTVIKETGWTFLTHARDVRSNSVNSQDARAGGAHKMFGLINVSLSWQRMA